MGAVIGRATLRGALAQVRHVTPVHPDRAEGLVAEVYRQVRHDFGMLAPPVILHSPAPRTLAAAWLMLRESLLASTVTPRTVKEAVAAAVSVANSCPYCVEVHTTTLRGLTRPRYAAAIAADRAEAVTDPALRAAVRWARTSATRSGAARLITAPPAADVLGVALTFHYLNRMVSVFLSASPLPPRVPRAARPGVRQVLGWLMAPTARAALPPGTSLGLLPDPRDEGRRVTGPFSPAENPVLAGAFERAGAAVDAAGARSVPASVRDLVTERLAAWDGRPAADDSELATALAGLAPAHRPVGRLALLTAFAPERAGRFLAGFPALDLDDQARIEVAAWASLAAVRRISQWLCAGAAA